ncbi:hypothetical protein F383_37985 [Gossypium arboreum]|uniref:Uncharacterized protein n=1 Tax=Gossypium arboreum TaxID=29729 RepID=A0A0B0M9W0_GOSAR|nr:hypothetical protein F383_37985 [Gossypium arboreum]
MVLLAHIYQSHISMPKY